MELFLQTYGRELIILAMLWVLPWKGVSLWRAVKRGDRTWFVALLLINSLAILDILYIFVFSRKVKGEVRQ
jgi:type IV secretory pathway TrbD component